MHLAVVPRAPREMLSAGPETRPNPQEDLPARAGIVPARRQSRSAGRPRRVMQFAWGAGIAAAAVVVVAAGLLTGTPEPSIGPTTPMSAPDLLRRASLVAEKEELAPRPGQLLHVVMSEVAATGGGPTAVPVEGSTTPTPHQTDVTPGSGTSPASSSNAEPTSVDSDVMWLQPSRWQGWEAAAGDRPGFIRIAYGTPRPVPGGSLPAQARRPANAEWRVAACTGSLTAPTYAFLATLPTDPRQLAKRVTAQDPDDTWDALSGLTRAPLAPPKLRAAVYQLMAEQPGVELVPTAVDAAGRSGIAVARTLTGRGLRSELIFDAGSYRYLGERQVSTATNVTIDSRAVLAVEIVDAPPKAGPNTQTSGCGANRLPR
ncbi:hypothetical protein GCM10009828_067600 [Actinoplanes couchii]|uniref:CU044_5270 family protein n=3 Tax=Actinoplanes couchii TaxID=403638 RepID=A0ABQ3XUE5_9ACTN|nr:hypothetical protein Aco03nite_104060 [Actinoplanes couchii]